MLRDHKHIKGNAPIAWKEAAHRPNGDSTRFSLIIDESDTPLGAVTDRFTLVQNPELLAAFDLVADRHQLSITPNKSLYRNGRSLYLFDTPDFNFQVPGDQSIMRSQIALRNDYRGKGGLGVMNGHWRIVCENGLIVGEIASQSLVRHVGAINLDEFLENAICKFIDQAEVERLTSIRLSETPNYDLIGSDQLTDDVLHELADGAAPMLARILQDTAPRYRPTVVELVENYRRELGDNLWAMLNAVTHTSTHRMRGWAAQEWGTRQYRRIVA